MHSGPFWTNMTKMIHFRSLHIVLSFCIIRKVNTDYNEIYRKMKKALHFWSANANYPVWHHDVTEAGFGVPSWFWKGVELAWQWVAFTGCRTINTRDFLVSTVACFVLMSLRRLILELYSYQASDSLLFQAWEQKRGSRQLFRNIRFAGWLWTV